VAKWHSLKKRLGTFFKLLKTNCNTKSNLKEKKVGKEKKIIVLIDLSGLKKN